MLSKEDLGERIRKVRRENSLTLKDLESASGFSATHISEIERGKTSPTIGVLVRLAEALGKEPSFFLEEVQLKEVAMVPHGERSPIPRDLSHIPGEYLTPGIPGGRLNAYMLYLDVGEGQPSGMESYSAHPGEEGAFLVKGKVEATVGDRTFLMEAGDVLHYPSDRPHGFRNMGDTRAELMLVSTKRVQKRGSTSGATGIA